MPDQLSELPRIDLLRHNAHRLLIQTSVLWTDQLAALFQGFFQDDGSYIGGERYAAHGKEYLLWLGVQTLTVDGPDQLLLTLEYELDEEPEIPRTDRVDREAEILPLIYRLQLEREFRCTVDFALPVDPEGRVAPVFPLPMRLSSPGLPFSEIRGIHGVKYVDDDSVTEDYRFTLDRPFHEVIFVSLTFGHPFADGFSPSIPENVLKAASQIANRFVINIELEESP